MSELKFYASRTLDWLLGLDWYAAATSPWALPVYTALLGFVAIRQVRAIRARKSEKRIKSHLDWAHQAARQRALGRP